MNPIVFPSEFPVTAHTDQVGKGSIFVAIKGFNQDGALYIPQALQKGATTVVVEHETCFSDACKAALEKYKPTIQFVANTRLALATLAAEHAGNPAQKLTIIGITGTKGKTTSVYLLEHMLRVSGIRVARISGVANAIDGFPLPPRLTTPQPDYLHQFFKLCVMQGVTHVVMEVAAQALSLDRVATLSFDSIVCTNIAREHLEFYSSMDEYIAAKKQIFNYAHKDALCLINVDNDITRTLAKTVSNAHGYSLFQSADFQAVYHKEVSGFSLQIGADTVYCPQLVGTFNAQNLLPLCIIARRYGVLPAQMNTALKTFPQIPGRFERYILPNKAVCIIDYAHNPSSYEALLSTVRELTDNMVVLFGASGTRDKGKRPLMGEVAARYADYVVLTADNPSPEDPLVIIDDIIKGIPVEKHHAISIEPDRARAIMHAYTYVRANSYLILLGKGNDEYQVINGTKMYFSERAIIKQLQDLAQ